MKPYLEALNPKAVVLGDSAFPLTDTMITPFTRPAVIGNHERSLFNTSRHSGARVECTEDTFGILKRRFPVLKDLRYDVSNSMNIVEMCCVFHNMSIDMGDVMPRDMFDDQENGRPDQILND